MTTPTQQQSLDYLGALTDHAKQLGLFRRVLAYEPKSAPGTGLSAAFWLGPVTPVARASGLAATTVRALVTCRIYMPFTEKPEESIDGRLLYAILQLIAAYSADFTLGGTAMEIDLLGMYGAPLAASAVGYISIDNHQYRSAEVAIPLILDAVAAQKAG